VPSGWLRVRFDDRSDAGRRLAARLAERFPDATSRAALVVLALPRGGVPVGYEVAVALHAPLDVILVRKIGLPSQPELAMGAIGEDGVRVVNDDVLGYAHVDAVSFAEVEAREREELERRAQLFRGSRARLSLLGRTAIVVDDGIATGSTVRAACRVVSAEGATRVIVATPVAPAPTVAGLRDAADELIVLDRPASFHAIGESYRDFTQLDDQQVVRLLARVES
jgi:putative phosphoribosyl transferase